MMIYEYMMMMMIYLFISGWTVMSSAINSSILLQSRKSSFVHSADLRRGGVRVTVRLAVRLRL